MSKVAIISDSTAYIPPKYIEKYDIRLVHSIVIWSGKSMMDFVDISPNEFYERLATAKEMPTTSQATPAECKQVLEQLVAEGKKDILAILISHKLSGTIRSMEQAADMIDADINLEIVDALSASMGTGWPVLEVCRAAEAGASLQECKQIAEEARNYTGALFAVDTLEFLHRGGRIGGAQRFIGTALNFKPLLHVVNGGIDALDRVRTRKKAHSRLVELAAERIGDKRPSYVAVLHANALEAAEQLLEEVNAQLKPDESFITEVSPAVGTHIGPQTVGIAYMAGYKYDN